eukprot:1197833-Lingulodinium_polyedra.AAC.1
MLTRAAPPRAAKRPSLERSPGRSDRRPVPSFQVSNAECPHSALATSFCTRGSPPSRRPCCG